MSNDKKIAFFDKIKNYYAIENNDNLKKLIFYYEKYWLHNKYINFEDLKNEKLINRANNYLESFHHSLNSEIEVFHPKLSNLIEKYKYLFFFFNFKNLLMKIFYFDSFIFIYFLKFPNF